MNPIRIVLADDHGVVRAGLRRLLDSQADFEVIAEAADGVEAVEQAARLRPDVCLFDLSMPRLSGAEAAARLIESWPDARVVVLTVSEDAAALQEAVRAGARGYVPKRAAAESLIHAVRVVAGGGVYVHPLPGGAAVEAPAGQGARGGTPSRREAEVLRLIALGFSNKEIASRLRVSVKTVETHKARAMEKLGLYNRVEVVRYAARMGWLRELWTGEELPAAPAGAAGR